jgi:SulP family sulfate permease
LRADLLAGLVAAAAGLIKVGEFQKIARFRRIELVWALVAFVEMVVLGTLEGIVAAVIVSMLALIYYANRPPVYAVRRRLDTNVFRPLADHPGDETFPGLLLRSEGVLYFASAPRAIERWAAIHQAQPRVMVLECSAIPNIEYTALGLLSHFEEKLAEAGVTLCLAALNSEALQVVESSALGQRLRTSECSSLCNRRLKLSRMNIRVIEAGGGPNCSRKPV